MRNFLPRKLRAIWRLTAFLSIAVNGLWQHRKLPRNASRAERAQWLHQVCGRGLRAIKVQVQVEGTPPRRGLIVSNHLSYLDILAYSAVAPCVFVSSAEVEGWPIFGRYARWAGSVFVRRHDRSDAARANAGIGDALHNGVPVLLFPEGGTSDGHSVLRFHSTMLQPAIDARAPVTPAAIHYELSDGDVAREVCWWGDMTLLPHGLNLFAKDSVRARISFGDPMPAGGDRKTLSARLQKEVARLHSSPQQSALRSQPVTSIRLDHS